MPHLCWVRAGAGRDSGRGWRDRPRRCCCPGWTWRPAWWNGRCRRRRFGPPGWQGCPGGCGHLCESAAGHRFWPGLHPVRWY